MGRVENNNGSLKLANEVILGLSAIIWQKSNDFILQGDGDGALRAARLAIELLPSAEKAARAKFSR